MRARTRGRCHVWLMSPYCVASHQAEMLIMLPVLIVRIPFLCGLVDRDYCTSMRPLTLLFACLPLLDCGLGGSIRHQGLTALSPIPV
jgi:hypothetical protein